MITLTTTLTLTTILMAIPMNTEHLLTLTQWLSPAYPVGGFAWSHGLETAIASGQVSDSDTLQAWLMAVLTHGAGRADAILLGAAHAATPDTLPEVAALADALAPSQERRAETLSQGAAFAATTREVWGLDLPDMAYPVVIGRAAALMGLPAVPPAQMMLQAMMSNQVQAAQRLMRLGQTKAQGVLARLTPLCARIAEEAVPAGLDALGSAAFAIDIAAMRHEEQSPRLFRS